MYSVTTIGGCVNTATQTVTVTAPIPQTIAGITPICVSSTALWTSTTTGGNWTSDNPVVASIGLSSGVVSGLSAGTSIITYTVTTSGGCVNTASQTVTVTAPIPQTIAGTTPLCIGSSAVWTSTSSGGTWTSSTSAIAVVDILTGNVTGVSAGTAMITYSVAVDGCTNTATKTVTVSGNISATISGGTSPICYNSGPGTFTANATGGNGVFTYQWYLAPSTLITNATNSTYNPGNLTSSSGYYCAVTGSCGSTNTDTINITVYPDLSATLSGGTSPICDKTSPGVFTATALGGTGTYTYQWYRTSSGLISGATNSTYNPGMMTSSNGFYCVVTSNPCGSVTTSTFNVTVIPQVGTPTPITVNAGIEPSCQLTNDTTTTSYQTTATNNIGFGWSISNPAAGSIDSATGVMTWANGFNGTVDIQVIAYGCGLPSPQIIRTVVVHSLPGIPAPTASPNPVCAGSITSLSASVSGSIIYWYTGSCGGIGVGTGSSITMTPATVTTYYARAYNSTTGCWSDACGSVTVDMLSSPEAVTVNSSGTSCATAILTATGGTGGTIYWQGTTSGGTSMGTPSTSQTVTASGTYYFRSYNSCTWGNEGSATVIINNVPDAVTVTGVSPICNGSSTTLTATGGTGGTIYWQGTTSGGTSTDTPSTAQVVSTTGTYYYRAYNDCGWGDQGSMMVVVNNLPSDPTATASPNVICSGTTTTLSSTVAGANVYWYTGTCGGTEIAIGNSIMMSPTTTTTYYARAFNATTGCWSASCGSVTVNIMTAPEAVTVNSNGTYCVSTMLTATGGTGGTIYWQGTTSDGMSTATPSSLQTVTVSGTYYFRSYNACAWGDEGMVTVTINNVPGAVTVGGLSPICEGNSSLLTATGGTNGTIYWQGTTSSGTSTASPSTSQVVTLTGTYYFRAYNDCGWSTQDSILVLVNSLPTAEAGTTVTYAGVPVLIGDPNNGPGNITWSPAAGLSSTDVAQPLASPTVTTTYTLTVENNGCVATDTVTVIFGGHLICGKTRYLGRANAGVPAPNLPTYNAAKYNIDNVIVILKSYPSGVEMARDTSDAFGNYCFSGVMDGNYRLAYDKFTIDTMQWANGIDAIDVTLLKYHIGIDTLQDPSRTFGWKYMRTANVDNNASVNAIDISRIKAKIGSPYNVARNFPKGNWLALDTTVTVAGSDLNVNLKTVAYGDYNASSTKYRDSLYNWSMAKSIPQNIIEVSDDYITTSDPTYFEIPLRISTKMNEFSALGLELNYQNENFKLVSASMRHATKKGGTVRINPTLDEIIANNDDLLVTDENGVIRVVYATTNNFDVATNDEIITLGFRSNKVMNRGELDFELAGTGVIGNQYGEENEDAYLIMPKVFVEGNDIDAGFDFAGYPNPFSGEATLTYNLPENGTVKLKVYNAIGELVSELVNESQESGKHTVVFAPKSLTAGMYTFRLEFTGAKKTKCLVLKMIH